MAFTTPILLLIFNRPHQTRRVFNAVRETAPRNLFIAGDGPRPDKAEDEEAVTKTRAVVSDVTWDCHVKTLFREENLGCHRAVSGAIDWFFENVDEGIILEDDCLPDQSFFRFCQELLERYRNDTRIMHISGNNFQYSRQNFLYSYYFSVFPHIWGWASWKRAWAFYDRQMSNWPEAMGKGFLENLFPDSHARSYWRKILQDTFDKKIDTWDYQWAFSCWTQNGLSLLPTVNLVSNIGFGITSTHTSKATRYTSISSQPISFPLLHPPFIIRDTQADSFTQTRLYRSSKLARWFKRIKHTFS